jgi:hypothetical protein
MRRTLLALSVLVVSLLVFCAVSSAQIGVKLEAIGWNNYIAIGADYTYTPAAIGDAFQFPVELFGEAMAWKTFATGQRTNAQIGVGAKVFLAEGFFAEGKVRLLANGFSPQHQLQTYLAYIVGAGVRFEAWEGVQADLAAYYNFKSNPILPKYYVGLRLAF